MELVSALKEGATSSLLGVPVVKLEAAKGVLVVDVEETFSSDSKEKATTSTFAIVAGPILPPSHCAQAIQAALASLGLY